MSEFGRQCDSTKWFECLFPSMEATSALEEVIGGKTMVIYHQEKISKNEIFIKAIAEDFVGIGFLFGIFPTSSPIFTDEEWTRMNISDIMAEHQLSEDETWEVFKIRYGESYVLYDNLKFQLQGYILTREELEMDESVVEALRDDQKSVGRTVVSSYHQKVVMTKQNGQVRMYTPIKKTVEMPFLHCALNSFSLKENQEYTYVDRGYNFFHALL